MKDKLRTALYGRVSSQAQAEEERVSLREQFSEMEKHCSEHGYEISGRYQDVAPGSTRKRPAFQQMLEDGREGRYDVILCWNQTGFHEASSPLPQSWRLLNRPASSWKQ